MATRLAICGLGQGMDHLEACLENESIRIVALVDKCPDTRIEGLEKIEAMYPDEDPPESYEELPELAGDDSKKSELDGVILALPHDVYGEEWRHIMQLGVPILKEKPLGRNVSEAITFLHEAHKRDILLMTAVQRRYHSAYRELRKLIVEPRTMVRSIRIIYGLGRSQSESAKNWRDDTRKSGGGMLLDAGYHMMDLVQFLVGTGHLVSATITKDVYGREIPCGREDGEDHCYITVGKDSMLISIECHRSGEKAEHVIVDTEHEDGKKSGRIELERGPEMFVLTEPSGKVQGFCGRWKPALKYQIEKFVENISSNSLDVQQDAYSQLPVQRIIHDAYALADPFSFGTSDRPRDKKREMG